MEAHKNFGVFIPHSRIRKGHAHKTRVRKKLEDCHKKQTVRGQQQQQQKQALYTWYHKDGTKHFIL